MGWTQQSASAGKVCNLVFRVPSPEWADEWAWDQRNTRLVTHWPAFKARGATGCSSSTPEPQATDATDWMQQKRKLTRGSQNWLEEPKLEVGPEILAGSQPRTRPERTLLPSSISCHAPGVVDSVIFFSWLCWVFIAYVTVLKLQRAGGYFWLQQAVWPAGAQPQAHEF